MCKCNLLNGNIENNKLQQDLKFNDADASLLVEPNDGVEIASIVSVWKDFKLAEVVFL